MTVGNKFGLNVTAHSRARNALGHVASAFARRPAAAASLALLVGSAAMLPGPFGLVHFTLIAGIAATACALSFRAGDGRGRKQAAHETNSESEHIERRIEELKDVAWQLTDNEQRYRDLLDAQADVILRQDAQGRLTFVNAAFCRVFGVTAEDVLGKACAGACSIPPDAAAAPGAPGSAHRRFECEVATKDGQRWFEFERHLVPGADGAGYDVQTVGRDITDARAFQAALATARDQALAADRAKSRFLAAMSHEIRTPMNGILGMASLVRETELTPEQKTYVSAIDQSAKTLLVLIDEILDFSKIEAGKLVLHDATFSLAACVQGVVELMALSAHEKGLELAWTLAPELPSVVIGDEARVRQVLINLIGNAVKFTDRGGALVKVDLVSADASAVNVAVSVQDTGIGLDGESLGRLFAEFGRGDAAEAQKRNGTGLGLAISRRLARAMGGDIEVSSQPWRGATFTLKLSLKPAIGASPVLARIAADGKGPKVLLAFDRLIERRALAISLRAAGVTVVEADASSASCMLSGTGLEGCMIDMLIVDGSADQGEAVELVALARTAVAGGNVRAVALIDALGKSSLTSLRAAGIESYLVRPVRPKALLGQLLRERNASEALSDSVGGEEAPFDGRGTRVLLAEDNAVNALLARSLLEKSGHEVVHVTDGEMAVTAVIESLAPGHRTFDVVLMDVHMPKLDGLEAARALKSYAAANPAARVPPIVALTANAFAEDRQRCLDAGLDDYLAKPFQRSELEALLKRWRGRSAGVGRAA